MPMVFGSICQFLPSMVSCKPEENLDMATMNISLPQALRQWVDDLITEGNYGTVSEYFRELIRLDQRRRAEERLEAQLLEGLRSGEPIAVTPEYIEQKRRALLANHTAAKRPKKNKRQ